MSKEPVENSSGPKKLKTPQKIMVFGTFDGVHKGHMDFFRQAKRLAPGSFLVVSVARDQNVLKIKGRLPKRSESDRLREVRSAPLVDKALLGGAEDHIPHILKESPDIIALGYDQKAYVKDLKKDLVACGLRVKVVRLHSFHPRKYKSHLLA